MTTDVEDLHAEIARLRGVVDFLLAQSGTAPVSPAPVLPEPVVGRSVTQTRPRMCAVCGEPRVARDLTIHRCEADPW